MRAMSERPILPTRTRCLENQTALFQKTTRFVLEIRMHQGLQVQFLPDMRGSRAKGENSTWAFRSQGVPHSRLGQSAARISGKNCTRDAPARARCTKIAFCSHHAHPIARSAAPPAACAAPSHPAFSTKLSRQPPQPLAQPDHAARFRNPLAQPARATRLHSPITQPARIGLPARPRSPARS